MRRISGLSLDRTAPLRVLIALVLAVFALDVRLARAQGEADAVIARIEGPQTSGGGALDALTLQALMERLHVPGLSIAVVKDFKLHWARAYGVADVAAGRPVDTHTRFQAASISKPVTALAALRLAQAHRLDLDADVNTLLKSWRVPDTALTRDQPVTPRALLSHTSGADDGFGFPGYAPGAALPTTVQILEGQAPSNVGKVVFARPPFTAYKYSGGGFVILQLALTELTGHPFPEVLRSEVLEPLQMTDSVCGQEATDADVARTALAHDAQGRRKDAIWHVFPEQAAACLWTTPSDLAKVIIELQTALRGPRGRLLEQRMAREMIAPVGVGPYGVGLVLDHRGEGWYFSHGGSNFGYRAWMIGHVRKGYGVVIMTNGDNGMALMNAVADRIAAAYAWDSLDKPLPR